MKGAKHSDAHRHREQASHRVMASDGLVHTRQFAELGAGNIKVERPGTGDFARPYDQRVGGEASHFVWVNRLKESLTLDLKQPAALQVLH